MAPQFHAVQYGVDDLTLGFDMEGSPSVRDLDASPGLQARRGKMLGERTSWGRWAHLLGRSVSFWKSDTKRLYANLVSRVTRLAREVQAMNLRSGCGGAKCPMVRQSDFTCSWTWNGSGWPASAIGSPSIRRFGGRRRSSGTARTRAQARRLMSTWPTC